LGGSQSQPSLALLQLIRYLRDLQTAEPDDPVYTLNPTLTRDIIEEDPESEVNKNYSDVIGYVSKEKKLKQLQEKVNSGFDSLVSSQKELEKVTSEVQSQEQVGSRSFYRQF